MRVLDLHQISQEKAVEEAVESLATGNLVIFPTETTYGAGVDALNQHAVDTLLAYKTRREGKPLSIAVADARMASQYVEVNDSAHRIYQRFLPGPVTVISRSLGKVAPGVESEFGTLGIRIPDYPLILEIVNRLGRPITATSANASGGKRPYSISDLLSQLSEKQKKLIGLVLDAGQLPPNPPSTVIDTTLSTPVVFRQGKLELVQNQVQTKLHSGDEAETKGIAQRLALKYWSAIKDTGLVIGLNGSLGMGKTIFVKGVAEFLQIPEVITSPTYSYVQEYAFTRHGISGKLIHSDVWKVDSTAEATRLELASFFKPGHLVIIEWASNIREYLEETLAEHQLPYIQVGFSAISHQLAQRQLLIQEPEASAGWSLLP